jgi:lambda repressor-like predicted transcriptional regulator
MAEEKRTNLTPEDVLTDLKKRGIDLRDLSTRRISLSLDSRERFEDGDERIKKLLRRD